MKTKAAVLEQIGGPLKIRELEIPYLKPGQVLVDMAYSGMCRSQLNEIQGKKGPDAFLPHTLGHEGSGVVLEVGAGVRKVGPGNHVVLSWIKGEGANVPSTAYRGAWNGKWCGVNSGAISTFMDKAVVSENRVTPIPKEMPLREAALLGCAVPTGAGTVFNTGARQAGSIAIFGVGGVGMSAVMAADFLGVETIIAIDVRTDRLELAWELGATCTLDFYGKLPLNVDCAIESSGQQAAMEAAFLSVRDNGGVCIIAGNLPYGEAISIDPFLLIRGRQIRGTWGGETRPNYDIPKYVNWFLGGKFPLDKLIGRVYDLENINEAIDDFGKIPGRALIKC